MKLDPLRLLYPKVCPHCKQIIPYNLLNCPYCPSSQRITGDVCRSCGLPADECKCEKNHMHLSNLAVVYYYSGSVREWVHNFKFDGDFSDVKKFSAEMYFRFCDLFDDIKPDTVTFVPMTEYAVKQRGYNQSEILAKRIAGLARCKCEPLLEKVKDTMKQHYLSGAERLTNLDGTIECIHNVEIKDKIILLVDDVTTSGATFYICRQKLLSAGAKDVYLLALATPKLTEN